MGSIITLQQLNNHLDSILSGCFTFDRFMFDYLSNLSVTGCRVNELFDLNRWSVYDEFLFQLIPQKNNNPRLIEKNILSESFINAVIEKPSSFYTFSYSQVNMYFKRFSVYPFVYHDSRPETMNLFRHRKCKVLKNEGLSDQDISDYFGEADIKNIRNYIYSELIVL